jgi:hypothetical protein
MCTNKYSLDLVTLMNKGEINDMKSENNFVEIIYETPTGWQRDCYNRSELLRSLQSKWEDTITFWGEGDSKDRVKAVFKFPYSGEYFTEDSIRLLSLPYFTQFYKVDCNEYKLGSYFRQSSWHGLQYKVCKLEPLIELQNTQNINLQDPGILSIQLREIPEEIYEQSSDITEEEKALVLREQEESDRVRSEQERREDIPPETSVERRERHELARERVFSRLFSQREYKSEIFPLLPHVFQRDRIVVYNNITNNITLQEWLQSNNFSVDIVNNLQSHLGNLDDLKSKTEEQLMSYGLSEEDANMVLSKYTYSLIDLDNTYNNCYTAKEAPGMPNRYYERYCFDSTKTAEEIFFKTPMNRLEIRGFHHTSDNSFAATETKLYVTDDHMIFKITAGNVFYTFGLFLIDNKFYCNTLNQNGDFVVTQIAALPNMIGSQPINQYTSEQFMRTCSLVFLLLSDIETTVEVISLVKVLSMGMSRVEMLNVYDEYVSNLFNNADETTIENVYNTIVNMYKNDIIQGTLGQFDDDYIITKNMFLILLLKYMKYEQINQGENSILHLASKNFGSVYKNKNDYNPIHLILQNLNLSSSQMIELVNILHNDFNVPFDSDVNLYATLITHSAFENHLPLANLFFDNNLDPTVDVNGISILHRAAIQGDVAASLVQWLIQKGADVNRVGRTGDIIANPFEMVYYLFHNDLIPESKKVLRLLKRAGGTISRTPFETIAKDDQGDISQIFYNIVYMMLNMRSREEYDFFMNYISFLNDVNITFKGYYNLLTAFCASAFFNTNSLPGDLENFLNILETKGFNFAQVDNNGYTPAMFLIVQKFLPDVVSQILDRDTSVISVRSVKDESLLQKCIENGDDYLPIVEKIVLVDVNEVFQYFTITTPSNGTEQSHAIKYSHSLSVNKNSSIAIYKFLSKCNNMNDFYLNIISNEISISSEEFSNLFFANKTPNTLKNLLSVDIFESNILMIVLKANLKHKFTDDNDFELFRKLVDFYLLEGGDINYLDRLEFNALSWAITYKYPLRIIQYLMSKNSNPDIPGTTSALVLADRANENDNYRDVINYLERQGATRFTTSVSDREEEDVEDFEETYFRHREESEEESEEEKEREEKEEKENIPPLESPMRSVQSTPQRQTPIGTPSTPQRQTPIRTPNRRSRTQNRSSRRQQRTRRTLFRFEDEELIKKYY